MSYCTECGSLLASKELEGEGIVPYCEKCAAFRFPMFNVAASMIVIDKSTGKILLIKQYGKDDFILVAGYASRGERIEDAAAREIKEETGMSAESVRFNRSSFFEKSNTLMCNFTAFVKNAGGMKPNGEIDSYQWFEPEEARRNILPDSLASKFLNEYLDSRE